MNAKNKKKAGVTVGTSLILVTFVLLCLVAFAALSFSTAQSDYSLSLQTAERKQSYYDACSTAEEKLQTLDRLFFQCYETHGKESEYLSSVADALSDSSEYTITREADAVSISFAVPVNTRENLVVVLNTRYPDTSDSLFTSTSYKTELLTYPDK